MGSDSDDSSVEALVSEFSSSLLCARLSSDRAASIESAGSQLTSSGGSGMVSPVSVNWNKKLESEIAHIKRMLFLLFLLLFI